MAYFPCHDNELKSKWTLFREVALELELSSLAREKLEWIIFFNTVGQKNITKTALYFDISRKTLHKWLKRFNDRNLKSLEEQSRSPHTKRSWMVSHQEEERVIALRKSHLKWGKNKLKVLYKKEYRKQISAWKIERVIRYHKLFPDPEKHLKLIKNKARRKKRLSIYDIEKKEDFGFLWHIDAVIIWWYGSRRVIFTAIEDLTKIAFARIYTTNNSAFAEDFLKRLMYLSQQKVEIMHSDNGAEFKDKFESACLALGIIQAYSRPRTPTDNPSLERFNRTIQEEWLELSETGLDDIQKANADLTSWLIEYNNLRPHQTLDYQTPLAYAYQNFPQVLPMSPASTKTCKRQRERVISEFMKESYG
ncbi:MAG: integrase core domain-containing protein, partial [Patescibacteria group bacterium]